MYFPRLKENIEVQRNKINLYSNQVFITDSVEEIVPEFLTLLHGVIDSPDIPLNVSRSYLQSDGNVKKISSHITKKVSDKLAEMFKKDRKDFESKWDDLQIFVQYGVLSDEKFADRAKKYTLFKNTEGEYFTIDEYKDKVSPVQTDKDEKVVCLYTNDTEAHYSYVKAAKERGFDVLELSGPLSSHLISKLEQSNENMTFARVDADTLDKLIKKTDEIPSKLSKEQEEKLKEIFEDCVNKEKFTIQFESLSESEGPVMVTQPEFMRRMMEQQKLGGGGMMGAFPEMFNMVVNSNHPNVMAILSKRGQNKKNTAKTMTDLALLSNGMLKGQDLSKFIERTVGLIN